MSIISHRKISTLQYSMFYSGAKQIRIEYLQRKRLWITVFGVPIFVTKEIFVTPNASDLPQ